MVTRDKEIMGGSPSINGRRINVFNLIIGIWYSDFASEYLTDMEISREDAVDALNYCRKLECNKNLDLSFCEGCLLDTWYEKNVDLRNIKWNKVGKGQDAYFVSEDGFIISFETPEEFEDRIFGQPGWVLAEQLLIEKFDVKD